MVDWLNAAIRAAMAKKEYFSEAYLANKVENDEQERYDLDERLSTLSLLNAEQYEDRLLDLYSAATEAVTNAARHGLNRCAVNLNLEKAGSVGHILGPNRCAKVVAHLFRTEGLTASVDGFNRVDVRWPKVPPHWEKRN